MVHPCVILIRRPCPHVCVAALNPLLGHIMWTACRPAHKIMTQNAWFIAPSGHPTYKRYPKTAKTHGQINDEWIFLSISGLFALKIPETHEAFSHPELCVPSLSTISLVELKVQKDDAHLLTPKFLGLMGFDRRRSAYAKANWAQLPRLPFISFITIHKG